MANDPLVSTQWLADRLKDPRVKILDASFKMPGVLPLPGDDYLKAHIPGAAFFNVDGIADHTSSLPHMFPSAEQFGRDVGALGVSNGDTVVLYDSGSWVAAPRAWWMFLAFGHAQGSETVAHAFAEPYDVTNLFVDDPALVTNFADNSRSSVGRKAMR